MNESDTDLIYQIWQLLSGDGSSYLLGMEPQGVALLDAHDARIRAESAKEIAALKDMLSDGAALQQRNYGNATETHIDLIDWAQKTRALLAERENTQEPTETSDPVQAARWLGKTVEADRLLDDDTPGHWSDNNGGDDDGDWIQDPMRGLLISVNADCAWIQDGGEGRAVYYPIRRIEEAPK
jgi:hypothetical protein